MAVSLQRKDCIKLAKTLPSRLVTFFQKHPTTALLGLHDHMPVKPSEASSDNPANSSEHPKLSSENESTQYRPLPEFHNPFRPWKNYVTGRWRGPRYGLRIQAGLVKLAAANGVEEFLPYTKKATGERARRREEHGLRIKGTGVGQRVKGRKWERTLSTRLDKRRRAMLRMPRMIYHWKRVSLSSLTVNMLMLIIVLAWSWTTMEEMAEVVVNTGM